MFQPADLVIMVSDKSLMQVLLVDDDLVKSEVKTVTSIPAPFIVSIYHAPTIVVFAASCGALNLANDCFDLLTVSVYFK